METPILIGNFLSLRATQYFFNYSGHDYYPSPSCRIVS